MKITFLNSKEIKQNLLLTFAAIFLLILFIFTTINQSKSEKRKKNTTALLNPKYSKIINNIQISDLNGSINLNKSENIWIISSQNNNLNSQFLPANSSFVEEFITELNNVINLYEVTTLSPKNKIDFFPDDKTIQIKYFYNDSDCTTLYFGKYDFSQTYRYFMTDKNIKVYEISLALDKFLQTSFQVWAEPYLISQNVLGKIKTSDIQNINVYFSNELINKKINSSTQDFETIKTKLLDLRHGGKFGEELKTLSLNDKDLILDFELGNKSEIKMIFYHNFTENEDFFVVEEQYKSADNKTSVFKYKISLWTYNRIKEIIL